jgi:hypothetical protein
MYMEGRVKYIKNEPDYISANVLRIEKYTSTAKLTIRFIVFFKCFVRLTHCSRV